MTLSDLVLRVYENGAIRLSNRYVIMGRRIDTGFRHLH